MKPLITSIISLFTAAIITGCGTESAEPEAPTEQTEPEAEQTESKGDIEEVEFPHMHGLAFTENGEKAYTPAHDGLRVFEDGIWKRVEGPRHDYMGFSMTADGFYSSGHPSMQTDYENPLGIIKSTDEGKSIEVLGLEGEVDFHLMSAGYNSGAIYVLNPQPNSSMEDIGLYVTTNEAQDWEKGDMDGVSGNVRAIAAHPEQQGIVAVNTEEGVFLSQDAGNTFEQVLSGNTVSALTFTHDDEMIAAVGTGKNTTLQVIDSSGSTQQMPVPEIKAEDAISYIAQNPQSAETLMVTTFEKDIFYTEDNGESWEKTVEEGKSQNNS
ncbi:glycosyl hydrolase [Salibacterium salarium]|uniref:Glycosyl hydrolase n=1 Tax=Salibacterium salarium TaxID=284579 RepID=A0A3R9P9E6_9BACI|nr:glycosyl hydrolase [Salibacterium salarium]RSL33304.1 glycosyl hydrolase [Salibacterium salarium]